MKVIKCLNTTSRAEIKITYSIVQETKGLLNTIYGKEVQNPDIKYTDITASALYATRKYMWGCLNEMEEEGIPEYVRLLFTDALNFLENKYQPVIREEKYQDTDSATKGCEPEGNIE